VLIYIVTFRFSQWVHLAQSSVFEATAARS
jgi:hypothetical protein